MPRLGGKFGITRRARVSQGEKLLLVLRAGAAVVIASEPVNAPALPANAFLINAAAAEVQPELGSIARLLLMFERLERSQRERLTA